MDADRLAPWYRAVEYAAFGRALERCRFAFLDRLAQARRVLLVGEGDGRVLGKLLDLAPRATFDVIEVSGAMVELEKRRAHGDSRVRFRREDARAAVLEPSHYDAVATFFFLDCFQPGDARQLVSSIARGLAPGGLWLHGDFAVPDSGWRRRHAQAWLWLMYGFFGVSTGLDVRSLPPWRSLLDGAGMRRVAAREQRWGMIVSEVFEKIDQPRK